MTVGAKRRVCELEALRETWQGRWEEALALWSRFTKLSPPLWCMTAKEEEKEDLTESFAMIRLQGHDVVVSLKQVREKELEDFALEILAHEIGHHVYAPADLRDNARLLARIRRALPGKEPFAGLIANLYTDLLINDRLQRSAGLDMGGVYRKLPVEDPSPLWVLYLLIYESLWNLPQGTLIGPAKKARMRSDARLGARVIRAYARHWLDGAGRFAALCLPYLKSWGLKRTLANLPPWLDTGQAGAGGGIPDGLTRIEENEEEGALHPAHDPELTGLMEEEGGAGGDDGHPDGIGAEIRGGRKNRYRTPEEYRELMKGVGVTVPEKDLTARYYRERAVPHLIPFPSRETEESTDPLPEGLDVWDVGSPVSSVDWMESVIRSPHVIPGVTTVQRLYGTAEGGSPEREPVDLYLGIDCSGSMLNPALDLSHPVLAGAIIVLSALRAGARAMACLSGEPGRYSQTDGFVSSERDLLRILTGYLGTGYAYGILRLKETFLDGGPPRRPTHVMVITDSDIFHMLGEVRDGWEIAERAVARAGGGATMVLHMSPDWGGYREELDRLREQGWTIHFVTDQEELVAFARTFARETYAREREWKP